MNTYLFISSLVGAAAVMAWRVRETTRPVTARKIVIPPLGMSTGFSMFIYPPFRISVWWALSAFLVGALVFSYPLIKSSKLTRIGNIVMLRRSPAFLWIILALFAIRFAARHYVEQIISPLQTGGLFFVLAFGMIVVWRVTMFIEYQRLCSQPAVDPEATPVPTRQNV
jgi:membrane protein CcdC involved in cytochrome C biogenesis